jgi:hypothetical protein
MTLRIRAVRDKGNLEKERIVLVSDSSENIGQYILLNTRHEGDDTVSANMRQTLWLPDYKVNAGDLVVIYTKISKEEIKEKINDDKTKTIFIYWGLSTAIWDQGNDSAVLVQIADWNWTKV